MIRPGADSLDKMGIRRSCKFSSWLSLWARCREQPCASCQEQIQAYQHLGPPHGNLGQVPVGNWAPRKKLWSLPKTNHYPWSNISPHHVSASPGGPMQTPSPNNALKSWCTSRTIANPFPLKGRRTPWSLSQSSEPRRNLMGMFANPLGDKSQTGLQSRQKENQDAKVRKPGR